MTKLSTVKREAKVGERILITNADCTFGDYDNGDILTVSEMYTGLNTGVMSDDLGEDAGYIGHEEYEVIVVQRDSNDRLTEAEAKIATLEAEVKALKGASKPSKAADDFFASLPYRKPKRSPNQRRADVIKRAKAFVADITGKYPNFTTTIGRFDNQAVVATFHVNAEKRTVVALVHGYFSRKLVFKGIAKCAPDDVFNADIGKAIALGWALGVKVPKEFTDAPKPTELVVGHITQRGSVYAVRPKKRTYGCGVGEEFVAHDEGYTVINNQFESWTFIKNAKILDDTDAVYS